MPKKRDRPLTNKQRRFVIEYVDDGNATQAAIRAGYSPKTARAIGSELTKKPHIARAITKRMDKLDKGDEDTQSRLLQELKYMAFLDMRDVVEWTNTTITLKPSAELPAHVARAVKSIHRMENGSIKIELYSRMDAIDKLMKFYRRRLDLEEAAAAGTNLKFTLQIGDRQLPAAKKGREIPAGESVPLFPLNPPALVPDVDDREPE